MAAREVRRRHDPVAVLVVLVDSDPVEAEGVRVLELVHILVVDPVADFRVEEGLRDIDPDGTVLLAKVVRQVRPGH
ncbi:MAG: hypothetical protein VCC67_07015, partial [Myxococcota bacterium]